MRILSGGSRALNCQNGYGPSTEQNSEFAIRIPMVSLTGILFYDSRVRSIENVLESLLRDPDYPFTDDGESAKMKGPTSWRPKRLTVRNTQFRSPL